MGSHVKSWLAILSFGLALLAAGCKGGYSYGVGGASGGGQAPTLTIVSPSDGATITGSIVNVQLKTENVTLKAPGGADKYGEGHLHVWLDTQETIGPETTRQFTGVAPGEHTITTELRNNNHSSYNPPVKASIRFRAAEAGTQPSAPQSGSQYEYSY